MNFLRILAVGLIFSVTTGSAWAAEKTLVYCSEGSPSTFNPQLATDGPTFVAAGNTIYDRLVNFEREGTKVVPSLAERWEIKNGGKTYLFHLRKGVRFHSNFGFTPTREFNADDVIYSFERMRDPKHPFHKVGGGNYEYFASMGLDKQITAITKENDYLVRFELSEPSAPFIANLGIHFASITSKEYAESLLAKKTPEKLDLEPIGTGPFIFQRYQKDTQIRFTANKEYWQGKPSIDRLVFVISTDASVRTQKLKAGECDVVIHPQPSDIALLEKDPKIRVLHRPGLNVGYLAMNTVRKPLDNRLVRQAIHHALNRESYVEAVYLGRAAVAKNPIPPTMWSYNQKIKDYGYSPEKAKALLKQAGLENGFDTEIWTLPVSRPYNPGGKKMGELMQADLAKVGIRAKLVTYDWPTYLKKSSAGEHVMLQIGWSGDNGDPDNFLNVLLSCSAVEAGANYSRWCDREFNDLILKASKTSDIKARTHLYEKAQLRFKQESPWVTLAHGVEYRAVRAEVSGFVINSLTGDTFYGVDKK